ncbi:MAG TPA: hypothetical protein VE999_09245 [Gemmataceae bacterium]|nr:hypothetical protein [Gemmataceae bacterium]
MLGRHVSGCPDNRAGPGVAGIAFDALGKAEVGYVGLVLYVEQDVAQLEVAV